MFNYTYWGLNRLPALDNMALEEFFLRDPTYQQQAHIRFYDFSRDTIVLGYNQALDALKKWDSSFAVTRRPSGGSHVQVGQNILAYSFIVPRNGEFSYHPDFREYYAEKIADALRQVGMPNITTDNAASTIMQGGKVIASHAVTWGVKSALLHGLVMIDPYNMDLLRERVNLGMRTIGNHKYYEADALSTMPTATTLLQHHKPYATPEQKTHYCKQLIASSILLKVAGTKFDRSVLSEDILERARLFQERKYAREAWIKQRDPTFKPEEIEELPGEELTGPLKEKWGYCLYIQVPDKDFKQMAEPREK